MPVVLSCTLDVCFVLCHPVASVCLTTEKRFTSPSSIALIILGNYITRYYTPRSPFRRQRFGIVGNVTARKQHWVCLQYVTELLRIVSVVPAGARSGKREGYALWKPELRAPLGAAGFIHVPLSHSEKQGKNERISKQSWPFLQRKDPCYV